MITIPGNVRVWLATGHTDMRRGFRALALLVQEVLNRDPHLCGGSDYVAEPPMEAVWTGHAWEFSAT
jgi:transposase